MKISDNNIEKTKYEPSQKYKTEYHNGKIKLKNF